MQKKRFVHFGLCLFLTMQSFAQKTERADICIYGGNSAGVIAAYTAKKMGSSVILIEPGRHLGGLSSGGLGYTDIGNKYVITGLSRDFYRRVGAHYGKFEQWIFEPHVAEDIFKQYILSAQVPVLYRHRIVSANKQAGIIRDITIENSEKPGPSSYTIIKARVFIDCSYEGDLMAKAAVAYFTGREANSLFNETYNGVEMLDKHQFPDSVDPYRVPGKAESGLLWGISNEPIQSNGSADKKIQAYNFRICLTDEVGNQVKISKPEDYDSSRYELLLRLLSVRPVARLESILNFSLMPNHKTDINNNGAFSTDMIGMNYDYPESDYAARKKIQDAHESYIKGLLYFIGHDNRMPPHLREEMLRWGYPRDEYQDNHNWSTQMYIREARRMKGVYIMTQANCQGRETVDDGVGMAAYTMDSHNAQRIVLNGMVKNEGDVQVGGFGPYPVSYRSIIPEADQCRNLLVPVCLSATHIAYGSIRMEPVFMVLAQSAAVAARLSIISNKDVQQVNIRDLQNILRTNPLADGSTAEILVDNDDSARVIKNGDWARISHDCYGPSLFAGDGRKGQNQSVRFKPNFIQSGDYRVYSYFPKLENAATTTQINVRTGDSIRKITIKDSDVRVEGQTTGEWVELGAFYFPKGANSYVEISTRGANGLVAADAILFLPQRKN